MNFKSFLESFNLKSQCRKYGLSLWQCPQFLFLMMGLIIIASTIITYGIGSHYIDSPEIVALITLFLTTFLLIISFVITQSFNKLAETNRIKSEFVSIVSHQLRAPLSNLSWTIETLMSGRMGSIPEKQTEYFKILKENSGRMKELVNDLLTVSRIEQGTLLPKKEEFSLEELINKLVIISGPFAKASNVEIKFDAAKNLPKIYGDFSQIRLVIENLLDNAVRYVKEKGIVEIKLYQKNKDICCEIKDNGVGIPKDDQKYIFQKFFRSENALRNQTQGSGLGLYIVKSIIKNAGGKIGFHSEERMGSTFWFTLPIIS